MSETIPGGRQRASSDGEIIADDSNINPQSLSYAHKKVSKSLVIGIASDSREEDDTHFIDTGHQYRTLPAQHKKHKRVSFKAVKKFVNRIGKTNSTLNGANERGSDHGTPVLDRRKYNGGDAKPQYPSSDTAVTNGQEISASVRRPLITGRVDRTLPKWEKTPGTVGLYNHGNTCFMNAVLQCLSNTGPLTEYFIRGRHKEDLRSKGFTRKFSGSKAEVTEELCVLLESIWSDRYSASVSNNFKSIIGKYNNQYKGTAQHDAQEFLLWILDRVNEDLQSVSKKRLKGSQNCDATDECVAEEVLANSNASYVYKLFQALYRSSLRCPDCHKQSDTFETYFCLSLPLPQKSLRPVYVTVVYLNEQPKQVRFGLRLNTLDTVKELREHLASMTRISETRIVLCQIFEDGFHSSYRDDQPLSDIPENNSVYAIEMFPPSEQSKRSSQYEEIIQIIVLHLEHIVSPSQLYSFCNPYVIQIPRDFDYGELQKELLHRLGSAVKDGIVQQNQDVLFKLRVVDGISGKAYLPFDVEMPLYMQTVDSALSYGKDFGQEHIKLVVEWDTQTKHRIILNDDDNMEEHHTVHQTRLAQQQPVSVCLDECFQLFTQEETLSDDDAWLCPHCKKQQLGTTKTIGLWSLPDVLIVHLKRFRQMGLRRNKLNTLVKFPTSGLNMSKHILSRHDSVVKEDTGTSLHQQKIDNIKQEEMTYDLYAVCNHYGNMTGGHYTAFCINPVDQKWYEYDDSKVREVSQQDIITRSAYLLFYQRRCLIDHDLEDLIRGHHWVYKICRNPENNHFGSQKNKKESNYVEKEYEDSRSPHSRPQTRIFTTPQQSRRQISSVQSVAKPAWSTPQPQRKHSHQIDDYKSSNFTRQNSIPHKPRVHSGTSHMAFCDDSPLRVELPPPDVASPPCQTKISTPVMQINSQTASTKCHMASPPTTPLSTHGGIPMTLSTDSPVTVEIKKTSTPSNSNANKHTSQITNGSLINLDRNAADSNITFSDSATKQSLGTSVKSSPSVCVIKTQESTSPSVVTSQVSYTNQFSHSSDKNAASVSQRLTSSSRTLPKHMSIVTVPPVLSQNSLHTETASSVSVASNITKQVATAVRDPAARRSLNQAFQQTNNVSFQPGDGFPNKSGKKYATMSRIRDLNHIDQFGAGDKQFLPRSQTDNSIINYTKPGNSIHSLPRPSSNANSVSLPDSTYNRYPPHRHHRYYVMNKDIEQYHKQEKMFSPILKESSV